MEAQALVGMVKVEAVGKKLEKERQTAGLETCTVGDAVLCVGIDESAAGFVTCFGKWQRVGKSVLISDCKTDSLRQPFDSRC